MSELIRTDSDTAVSGGPVIRPVDIDAERVVIEPEGEDGPPVDPPRKPVTWADITSRPGPRTPIVPASLRSKAGRRSLVKQTAAFFGYELGFHGLRLPLYTAKVAVYAPWGAGRIAWRVLRWAGDTEGWSIRQDAASRNDVDGYLKLSGQRDRRVSARWWVLAFGLLAVATLSAVVRLAAPTWAQWAIVGGVVLAAAWVGQPVDHPIITRVYSGDRFVRLTATLTRQAIIAAGVPGIREPTDIRFLRDIRSDGPGHEALVLLKAGVLATDVIDRRDRLAAAYRLPKTQVWPSPVPDEHPGVLSIWVADKPVSAMKAPPWPLLRDGTTFDYFTGTFVYGHDERMRPVTYSLAEKNSLFAGIPGSGKTLAARVVLLAAVLDPLVVPVVYDLKGSGDIDCMEPLCPPGLYGSGADEATKQAALAALEWLLAQCDERAPLVRGYAKQGVNNVNKVNRVMAERDPRLRPVVAFFDELQELITDPDLGKRAKFVLTSVVKRGRALGIHIIFATQRIDKESVPRGISSNIALRTCLAVTSHVEVNLVLGTGAFAAGARPTEFEPGDSTGPKDSGWGYQAGNGRIRPVKSCYVDNPTADKVVQRAIEMRRGTDPVEVPKVALRNLLADVRAVWHEGEDALWSEIIVPRLIELDPDAYDGLTVEVFGAWMAKAGVPTASINRRLDGEAKRATRAGVRLDALEARINARRVEAIAAADLDERDPTSMEP